MAQSLLLALSEAVLDAPANAPAKAVLDRGPFAMRKAEDLAELVLREGDVRAAEREEDAVR